MYKYVENYLPVLDYIYLVETAGWSGIIQKGTLVLEDALSQSWYMIAAYDTDNNIIGCGRIISDGHVHALICDIIVVPNFQSKGVGSSILQYLIAKCRLHDIVMIELFSAKDKADFYIKNGFERRANDAPGMYYVGNS